MSTTDHPEGTMARKVYEDEFVTEYDDGTEEVRFTDEEWEVMLADPKFGYVCRNGHRLTDADHRYGACFTCENEAEAAYADLMAAEDALTEAALVFLARLGGHPASLYPEFDAEVPGTFKPSTDEEPF